MDLKTLGRGVVKLVAVVVAAGGLGFCVGAVLAEVTGGDAPAPVLRPKGDRSETGGDNKGQGGAGAPAETGTTATPPPSPAAAAAGDLRVEVLSASLLLPTTPDGQNRNLVRLSVRVRLRNVTDKTVKVTKPVVAFGEDEIGVNVRAAKFAGKLLEPLGKGDIATGELRFKTEGAVTQRLQSVKPVQLRIAGMNVPLTVRTVEPGG